MKENKRPTSAKPIEIDGVIFRCYHVGILLYRWESDDGRCTAQSNRNATYSASVDGVTIRTNGHTKRFRSIKTAMRGAVTLAKGTKPDAT